MTIKYKFVTGEEVYIEVYGRLEKIMNKLNSKFDLKRYNHSKKEYMGLSDLNQSDSIINYDINPENQILNKSDKEILHKAITKLEPDEQKFVKKLYLTNKPISQKQYANILGVTESAIQIKSTMVKEKLKQIISALR